MDDFENMTEFSPFTWQPVYSDGTRGEMMDFNIAIENQSQLSSSRGVLETIVEETSDDETENGLYGAKWSESDSFSSGSSETGSVVHVETQVDHDNQDTISERDFICPPKRRRQEIEQPKLDFIPTSSLFSQLLNVPNAVHNENGIFDSYFMKQNDLRYRFDELGVELFSDSDRLSFTSLSRSSSLIQFESLERQLQSDSQISGSSPSIYSYEGANTNIQPQDLSEKSAPIAINLPSIKITNSASSSVQTAACIQFTNSDSEPFSSSSTSGSFSSDDSEILATVKTKEVINDSSLSSNSSAGGSDNNQMLKQVEENNKKKDFRAKNSVDSLSEDSGYCDRDIRSLPAGALSLDASLPNSNDLEDEDGNVIEVKSILMPRTQSDDDICYHSMESISRRFKSRKIEDSHDTQPHSIHELKIECASANEHCTMGKNKSENLLSVSLKREQQFISISSPELHVNSVGVSRSKRNCRGSEQFTVSSLPDNLNLIANDCTSESETVASKNFNLFDFNYGNNSINSGSGSNKKVVDISASCANLTLLNYSDDCCYDSHRLLPINRIATKTKTMSGKYPPAPSYHDDEDDDEDDYIASYRSKELTSLLEEISAHFNKNLSILNDREASYEPQTDVRDGKCSVSETTPPKAPPRARTQIKTSPNHKAKASFDRDPTNLSTTYAQSLEKCNFNIDEPVNVYSSRQNVDSTDGDLQKSVHKRNFVSSTPNLNYFDFEMRHVQHYSSIDNTATLNHISGDHLSPSFNTGCTSMKEIPSSNSRASSTGILASHSAGGSRSGLSVSFCPIVSEISWQVSQDDDEMSDDVDMDPSAGDDYGGTRNDSLVNYYNDTNATDDDDEEDFDDFRAVGTSTTPIQTQNDDHDVARHIETLDRHQCNIETLTQAQNETIIDVDEANTVAADTSSNKMLVDQQTPSEKFISAESSQTMTTVPQNFVHQLSAGEKPLKGSKQKKSLFSRLSSGFRFSFRGKKNKKLVSDGVVHYPVQVETNNNNGKQQQPQQVNENKVKTAKSSDFVFIPLKDPHANHFNSQNDKLASDLHEKLQNEEQQPLQVVTNDRQSRPVKPARESPPKGGNSAVMGKPPLPKQPPRIVGTTTKRTSAHPQPRASSTPREYDNGEFYQHNMLGDGLKQQYYSERARTMDGSHKIGLIETNLDTDETIINGKTQSLMELGIGQSGSRSGIVNRLASMGGVKVMNQSVSESQNNGNSERGRPHKSMEFLLDKENHQRVLPPENELQKARESNVTLSEHQLRVQASLQKLNIPDWYKQYSATGGPNAAQAYVKNPDVSGILRKRNSDIGRWQGLSSKTTSLSSLGSNRSDRSPVMLSPSAHSHHGGQTGFSRWSTSQLNSSQTSPSVSARSSFVRNTAYASTMSGQSNVSSVSQTSDIRNSFRKPYLGWRSQEKLNQPRTAHERLASSLMSQKQQHQQPIATPEIQSSIKEVSSAIVHYVNDQTNRGSRSRSVSPSTRCWLESSFVGTKPLESPQTPALENQFGVANTHKTVNIGPMSVTATNYETKIRLNGIGGGESSVI